MAEVEACRGTSDGMTCRLEVVVDEAALLISLLELIRMDMVGEKVRRS